MCIEWYVTQEVERDQDLSVMQVLYTACTALNYNLQYDLKFETFSISTSTWKDGLHVYTKAAFIYGFLTLFHFVFV